MSDDTITVRQMFYLFCFNEYSFFYKTNSLNYVHNFI